MDLREESYVRAMVRLCLDGWSQGWHEMNAGNLSYRLTDDEASQVCDACMTENAEESRRCELDEPHPALADKCIAITASGSYFKNAADSPNVSMGVLRFDSEGRSCCIVAGFENGARPSSELAAHVLAHEALIKHAPEMRVLYHAHTPAIVSVTNVTEQSSEVVTQTIWSTMIECMTVFPRGIGVVPPMVPGTRRIAEATAELLKARDLVVWSHHGILSPGRSFDEAFGRVHMVEKAARVWCDAAAAAGSPALVQGVSRELLEEISEAYGLGAAIPHV